VFCDVIGIAVQMLGILGLGARLVDIFVLERRHREWMTDRVTAAWYWLENHSASRLAELLWSHRVQSRLSRTYTTILIGGSLLFPFVAWHTWQQGDAAGKFIPFISLSPYVLAVLIRDRVHWRAINAVTRRASLRTYLVGLLATTVAVYLTGLAIVQVTEATKYVFEERIFIGWVVLFPLVPLLFVVMLELPLLGLMVAASLTWILAVSLLMTSLTTARFALRRAIEYPGSVVATVAVALVAVGEIARRLPCR
jgi:hypothetical protein